MTSRSDIEAALEAILFVTAEPVSTERLLAVFEEDERTEASAALESLRERYRAQEGRGVILEEVAGGLRIVTAPEHHAYLKRFFAASGANRLSMAALETLAIVAYRQPVTAPEIQELRGKNSTTALKTLLERRMVRIGGRREVVGRPFEYATTREFLMHFGLRNLADLPPLEEFEEAFSEAMGEAAISHEHEVIGLVSSREAEASLGVEEAGIRDEHDADAEEPFPDSLPGDSSSNDAAQPGERIGASAMEGEEP